MGERGAATVLQPKWADPLPPAMAFTDDTVAQLDEARALVSLSFVPDRDVARSPVRESLFGLSGLSGLSCLFGLSGFSW